MAPSGLGHPPLQGGSGEFGLTLQSLFDGTGSLQSSLPIDGSVPQSPSVAQQNPLQALIGLVQSGVPVQQIAADVARQIASVAAQKLGNDESGQLQATIQNLISNAISPPGNGPPGSSPPQGVAALAKRLQQWLNDIAGEAQGTGQQSEFSEQLLDALTAKDSPAQQNPTQATPVTTASIARALLDALTSFIASGPAQSTPPFASGTPGRSGGPFALGRPGIAQGQLPVAQGQPGIAGGPVAIGRPGIRRLAPDSPVASGQPGIANGDVFASGTPGISGGGVAPGTLDLSNTVFARGTPGLSSDTNLSYASGAPGVATDQGSSPSPISATDLLARIVSRAATLDANLHGVATTPQSSSTTPSSLATSAARLASALATTVLTAPSSSSNGSSQSFAGFTGNERQSQSLFASVLDSAFNTSLSNVGSQTAQLASNDATAAAQTPVDVNAVVEQMLKGIQLRTVSQGTSEIRLNLHPENLGEVSMKLTVQGSQISANVIAQNSNVRDALMNNQQHLATALAESGLSLSGFSVDVSGGNAGQQQQFQSGARGFGRRYVVHELAANGTATDATSSQFGPPLIPASSLGLFNSLA